jgi:hypothetical protein
MGNVSVQVVEEIKKICAHFFFENRAVYGIMWGNTVQSDGAEMAI